MVKKEHLIKLKDFLDPDNKLGAGITIRNMQLEIEVYDKNDDEFYPVFTDLVDDTQDGINIWPPFLEWYVVEIFVRPKGVLITILNEW